MPWDVANYRTAAGEQSVQRFVTDLPEPARVEAVALLLRLAQHGNALRPPHTKGLDDGLFELRGRRHGVRIFFMFRPGRRIVLLGGIVKKRTSIPRATIRLMRARLQEVLDADG